MRGPYSGSRDTRPEDVSRATRGGRNQLLWWHEGQVVRLPVTANGNQIAFAPPDEFVALPNTLAAP